MQARGTNLSLLATLETGKPSVIPEDTVTLELRIAASTTNPIDGDLRAQLELGATVFVSVASGHLTLLAVGQVLQRSLDPADTTGLEGGGN